MVESGSNVKLPPLPLKSSFLENETKNPNSDEDFKHKKKAERTKTPLIFLHLSYLFQLDPLDVEAWGGVGQGASCLE